MMTVSVTPVKMVYSESLQNVQLSRHIDKRPDARNFFDWLKVYSIQVLSDVTR